MTILYYTSINKWELHFEKTQLPSVVENSYEINQINKSHTGNALRFRKNKKRKPKKKPVKFFV